MKNKLRLIFSIIVCIALVFAIIASFGAVLAERVYTPEYFISQMNETNTCKNAYNALMKKFSDNYSVTMIPIDVYEKSVTEEWMKDAAEAKIRSSLSGTVPETDYSAIGEYITDYFEEYAHNTHVIKDETYEKKLAEAVESTKKTVSEAVDVYSFDVMKRAGIIEKLDRYMGLVRRYKIAVFIGTAVLFVILIILKRPIYWGGTALFASGLIMAVPAIIIKANGMIDKFSLKSYTTYTLVTGFLENINKTVMTAGIAMFVVGAVLVAVSLIFSRKEKND